MSEMAVGWSSENIKMLSWTGDNLEQRMFLGRLHLHAVMPTCDAEYSTSVDFSQHPPHPFISPTVNFLIFKKMS